MIAIVGLWYGWPVERARLQYSLKKFHSGGQVGWFWRDPPSRRTVLFTTKMDCCCCNLGMWHGWLAAETQAHLENFLSKIGKDRCEVVLSTWVLLWIISLNTKSLILLPNCSNCLFFHVWAVVGCWVAWEIGWYQLENSDPVSSCPLTPFRYQNVIWQIQFMGYSW